MPSLGVGFIVLGKFGQASGVGQAFGALVEAEAAWMGKPQQALRGNQAVALLVGWPGAVEVAQLGQEVARLVTNPRRHIGPELSGRFAMVSRDASAARPNL